MTLPQELSRLMTNNEAKLVITSAPAVSGSGEVEWFATLYLLHDAGEDELEYASSDSLDGALEELEQALEDADDPDRHYADWFNR